MQQAYQKAEIMFPNDPAFPGLQRLYFDKMKELASELSRGFPELRVDFYNVGNQIYFGELTLFHFSGFVPFVPSQWDLKFGEWINLPEKK